MADSSDIDQALIAKLQGDAALATLAMPGVFVFWENEAPPNASRFISVALVDEHDEDVFGGTAFEDAVYDVKWVELSSTVKNAKAGAARIQVVLHDQTLTVPGYTHMAMYREERIRMAEPLPEDSSKDWYHRGGRYRVQQAVGT